MGQSQGQERRRSRKQCKDTWAEFANLSSKTPAFKMGLKEEELTLIHVVQATDGGGIAKWFSADSLFH
jgi:uncharacterized protein YktB (UPF0637 family)